MSSRNNLIKEGSVIPVEIVNRMNAYDCAIKADQNISERVKNAYEQVRKNVNEQIAQGKKICSLGIQNCNANIGRTLLQIFEEDEFIVKRCNLENNNILYIELSWDGLPLRTWYPGGEEYNKAQKKISMMTSDTVNDL